ncbi:zeta toxin family protein [Streptomyces sp. NPDC087297]|uniref:zeta toxin family protein n=1 Tax=Streptomyces sp. NPDC087297 TaxID=3365778 RepID=UPI0037FF07B0
MSERYLLSEEKAREIFNQDIDDTFSWSPNDHPTLSVVAAQPGAGKNALQQQVAAKRHAPVLDLDELRILHPDHAKLNNVNDRAAAELTHADCRRWLDWVFDRALEKKSSIVWSCTLGNAPNALARLQRFSSQGYTVEIYFLAVHEAMSRLGILKRYQTGRSRDGWGRFTPRHIHDEAYVGLLQSAAHLEGEDLLRRVYLYKRGGRRLFFNDRQINGHWASKSKVAQRIGAERDRAPWPPRDRETFWRDFGLLATGLPYDLRNMLTEVSSDATPFLISWSEAGALPLRTTRHRAAHGRRHH